MQQSTYQICKAALQADPSLTPAERTRRLAALRAEPAASNHAGPENPLPVIVRPAKAASMADCTPRQIHSLAREGLLEKVRFPGRQRAAGITLASLTALLSGKAAA